MVAGTARLRKAEETTPAEWWKKRQKGTHNEQVRNGPKQRKKKTAAQVGRPHGMGRHRHRGIKATQNKRPPMVESHTNKTQIKMGRSTSQKILILKVGNTKLQNAKNTNMENQATHKTMQAGYTKRRAEKNGKTTNNNSERKQRQQQQLEQTKRKQKESNTFQEIHESFWIGKKSFW